MQAELQATPEDQRGEAEQAGASDEFSGTPTATRTTAYPQQGQQGEAEQAGASDEFSGTPSATRTTAYPRHHSRKSVILYSFSCAHDQICRHSESRQHKE